MVCDRFEAYLSMGWREHSAHPAQVANVFAEGLSLLVADRACESRLPDFARLIEHVYLAHLGVVGHVEEWLDALERQQFALPTSRAALARLAFAAGVAQGRSEPVPAIPDHQRYAGFANGLVAQCISSNGEAAEAVVLRFVHELPSASARSAKALAGAMNSLAFHLMQFPLTSVSARVTISAARLSRDATQLSGQWRDVARAENFLGMAHLATNCGAEAIATARRSAALCARHNGEPADFMDAATVLARGAAVAGQNHVATTAIRKMTQLLTDVRNAAQHARLSNIVYETRSFVDATLACTASSSSNPGIPAAA